MTLGAFDFTTRARPIVEIGTGDSRAPLGTAQWDSALWAGKAPVLQEPFDNTSAWNVSNPAVVTIISTGRTANAMSVSGSPTITWAIPAASQSAYVTVGFAVRPSITTGAQRSIAQLRGDTQTLNHLTLRVNTDATLSVVLGALASSIVLASSAANVLTVGAWNYVELAARLHDTLGFVQLRVNGTLVASASNVDTRNAGTAAVFDGVTLTGIGTSTTIDYDDLYVSSGATMEFLGAITVPMPAASVWAGNEPVWIDITCDVESVRIEYGRAATTDRFIVGLATVVANNDSGWADPPPTQPPAPLDVRPGREIRIGVQHDVYGRRWLYRGFIDAVTPRYYPTLGDTVQFDCIDALGEVNRAKLLPQPNPIDDGQAPVPRVAKILDLAQWSSTRRDLSASVTPLGATDYGGQVADMLGITADSIGGVVFGEHSAGRIVFRGSSWPAYNPASTPDFVIGNVGADDVCPVDWRRPYDRADIATRVLIGRTQSAAQQFDDPVGQSLFGIEPFTRTNLLTKSDNMIFMLGQRILALRGYATAPRVRSVSFDAATDVKALDLMSSVDPLKPSVCRCRLHMARGEVFDARHFATGVVHNMTRAQWTLDLSLDLAATFATAPSGWDESYWNQRTWS